MHAYGTCISYKEHRRFKTSAAHAAIENLAMTGISDAAHGLVQGIVDNFDADIASQNGKQSTHSLAVLFTQHSKNPTCEREQETVRKIRRVENDSHDVFYEVDIQRYQGPKQPKMPDDQALKAVPALSILCKQVMAP